GDGLAAIRVRRVLAAGGAVTAALFSPDGSLVLSVAGKQARIFSARTGRRLRTLAHPAAVTAARFSPDGRILATGAADGTARLWPLARGAAPIELASRRSVKALAWAPGGGT